MKDILNIYGCKMPVISSQIIEDHAQADGRRWVAEEHTTSLGEKLVIRYLAAVSSNVAQIMADRVDSLDQRLKDREISVYLSRIEQNKDVTSYSFPETTAFERVSAFVEWAKEQVQNKDHDAVRYAWKVTEPYTEGQIDTLLGTGMGTKLKTWEEKFQAVDDAMEDSEEQGGVA